MKIFSWKSDDVVMLFGKNYRVRKFSLLYWLPRLMLLGIVGYFYYAIIYGWFLGEML